MAFSRWLFCSLLFLAVFSFSDSFCLRNIWSDAFGFMDGLKEDNNTLFDTELNDDDYELDF